MKVNLNNPNKDNLSANIMYVDMNSFFVSCEQQRNYWLRDRPVGVCVYTGRSGAVIALSKTAKKMGIKAARVDEIMKTHPEFVPLPTDPALYREYHIKIMKVLQQYSTDVIPKSIDEAVINFSGYHLVYKDLVEVAREIKRKIKSEVGDYLTCSIGIAPNAFLAKLATDVRKPDGLLVISPQNIDSVLEHLALTDLPGIGKNMAWRLVSHGINSPLQLRYTEPHLLRKACHSIIGEYWHYRLNFREVDIATDEYKSMQAMRQVSKAQRASLDTLRDIIRALCMQLEKRMMKHQVKAHYMGYSLSYEDGFIFGDKLRTDMPLQDGIELMNIILDRIRAVEHEQGNVCVINNQITAMSMYVTDFQDAEIVQLNMWNDTLKTDNLRKVVYSIKDKFGYEKLQHAAEIHDTPVLKDVIGFGSVKDLM
jgi:DNA polymerase IV